VHRSNDSTSARDRQQRIRKLALDSGGLLRTRNVLRSGKHSRDLYALVEQGELVPVARGIYRLADYLPQNPEVIEAMVRLPKAVLFLISALDFHDLTTQIPRRVQLAVPRGTKTPSDLQLPVELHRVSEAAYSYGIEQYTVEGNRVRVYSPEKSVTDCFKHRANIGLDVCLEALRAYRDRGKSNLRELYNCAALNRVSSVMQPYIEALWAQK
jgi:predicted transcriptional regulator of viral defense system